MKVVESFLQKYYDDTRPRQLMFGINPGRHGAGITGVNFTAARQLTHVCGIDHPFKSGTELSAEFIYDMIGAYGGVSGFYSRFFIPFVRWDLYKTAGTLIIMMIKPCWKP